MTKMDKQYIEKEYEQAIKEYNAALTEDDLDTARRTMSCPGLLLSLKRKIIPGKPGAVDGRQL